MTTTDQLVEKIKTLHSEHCHELNQQIESLQNQLETRSTHVINLETKLRNALNAEKLKDTSILDMKGYIQKMELLLQEKKHIEDTYEEKLQV